MRTTIVIDDGLAPKLKRLTLKRGLSEFINQCLREHFEKEEKKRRLTELEQAYRRAAKEEKGSAELEPLDLEGWPEW